MRGIESKFRREWFLFYGPDKTPVGFFTGLEIKAAK
jgi:hypothetical protein